jgi:hypothetical protein
MPSQWAYPLWVAGNNITTMDYKTITSGCPWGASAVLSGMLYTPSGKWLSTPIANTGPGGGRGYGVTMWPYSIVPANSHLQYYYPLKDKNGVPRYSLFKPMLMCANANDYGVFGEPDGLDFASSFGAAGGDILDFNGKKYLLIQREMSTANQTSAAMLLE